MRLEGLVRLGVWSLDLERSSYLVSVRVAVAGGRNASFAMAGVRADGQDCIGWTDGSVCGFWCIEPGHIGHPLGIGAGYRPAIVVEHRRRELLWYRKVVA